MITLKEQTLDVPPPTTVVSLGAGDVFQRKVMPEIYHYWQTRKFNHDSVFCAVDFKEYTESDFRMVMRSAIENSSVGLGSEQAWQNFESRLFYIQGNFWGPNNEHRQQDYQILAKKLYEINSSFKTEENFLFYFGLPCFLYAEVTRQLSAVGLLDTQRKLLSA